MKVENGHRVATLCHLGNIARWLGRRLKWDPEKEIFPGDDEANKYLDVPETQGLRTARPGLAGSMSGRQEKLEHLAMFPPPNSAEFTGRLACPNLANSATKSK